MSEARAVEEDMTLSDRRNYRPHTILTVRPCAGNGSIITAGTATIRLTLEERRRVAKALWPDAFKEKSDG